MGPKSNAGHATGFSACRRRGGGVEWVSRRSPLVSIFGAMAYLPAYRKREEHSGSWSPESGCLRGRCTVPGGAESRMGRDDIGPGGATGLGSEIGRYRSGLSGRSPMDDVTLILGRIEQGESQASAQL